MAKGERIKVLREQFGFTQDELAEKIGTTKQTIYKYEMGLITNIPSDKIEALAKLFNVSPSYLMGWVEADHIKPCNPVEKASNFYINPEAAAFAQEISERPGLRALFSAARDVNEEDLRFMVEMAERFKKELGED